MFKPYPQEFLQSEFDELAAVVGKPAEELEWEFVEGNVDGLNGRHLQIKGASAPAPVEAPAPAEPEPAATAPAADEPAA